MTVIACGLVVFGALVIIRGLIRCSFYQGYFRQKQLNAGRNPDDVVKEVFPHLWWMII